MCLNGRIANLFPFRSLVVDDKHWLRAILIMNVKVKYYSPNFYVESIRSITLNLLLSFNVIY